MAVGQIFFGPLSDKYGRRPVVIASLWLFIASTLACLWSASIEMFVTMRVLQGIGGSGGIVLSRSIATDRYWGEKLAKMMAVIGAIQGIAPVAAPIVGGMMTDSLGWKGIFTLLMIVGALLLVGSYVMRESLKPENRSAHGLLRTFAAFGKILRNRRFVCLLLQYGFAGGVFFSYISASPFIIQQHYGYSPFFYSVTFGVNALFFGIAAASSMRFKTPELCTHVASIGMLATSVMLLVLLAIGIPFLLFELLIIVLLSCIGLCFSSTVAMAMNEEHENAGAASALIGAMIFLLGAIVSPLVGIGNIILPTSVLFVLCSLFSLLFDIGSRRK